MASFGPSGQRNLSTQLVYLLVAAPSCELVRRPAGRRDDRVTGDEEMTGAQKSYLHTLAEEAHEPVEPDLTKAEASKKIDRLKAKTGRGRTSASAPEEKKPR